MKRITLSLLALLLTCAAWAQEKTYDLTDFHAVRAGSHFDVIMERGERPIVRVEGNEEALRRVEVAVKDGALRLGWESDKFNRRSYSDRVRVYVTYQRVDEVESSGSGNFTCHSALTGDHVRVRNSGSGNMTLTAIEADEFSVSNSGSGNLDLAGRVRKQEIRVSGSGDISAFDLVSERAKVSISGSSNVDLHVTKTLDARISGSGDVRYRGRPNVENLRVSGSGEISSAD
ncbi:MAG: head GIN domain-containing protein [Catalinimonas sp.]